MDHREIMAALKVALRVAEQQQRKTREVERFAEDLAEWIAIECGE